LDKKRGKNKEPEHFSQRLREGKNALEVKNLTVYRRNRAIVHNLDFCARAGEVTIIVGPNGSGKSTLMGALSGELAYQGSIWMNGRDMAKIKPEILATMRGVLPQASHLSFPFLVREVVALGMMKQNEARKNLPDEALERVDLAGFGGRFYQELSGGEQARVQLARILVQIWHPIFQGEVCWLMLDEPVAALDIQHQLIVMDVARDFAHSGGGVVAILHDLNLASCYSNKMVLLDKGRVVASGTADEVITTTNLGNIYHCDVQVGQLPPDDVPFILPQSRQKASLS